ncbi:MAG: serine protease, partial [Planctomycetaceae bacterium]|nr:serine protease [Planctomycetaceae bacterium]
MILRLTSGSVLLALALFAVAPAACAQSVCLPLPRLLTTMPMGGTVGSQVEITITGENIEDISQMIFTHPGLTAVPKSDENGQAVNGKYVVSIAPDCPAGVHEARLMTRLGISSSRVFCVDTLNEVTRMAANVSLETALELQVNSIANAVMTDKSVDHYAFNAVKGHRYIVHCASRGIDSKLDAVLIIGDAAGRDLVVERRGGILDFTAGEDGRHVIKVHDLTFKGGPAWYYRLSLQEIAADAPLPEFASTKTVNSFSWPPRGISAVAETPEAEPNNAHKEAQQITLPCDISGNFFPAADVDRFEFTATKGDVWWVEVASERLGRPTDPAVLVQHVSGEGSDEKLTDVAEFTDIASPMKPSSNGYAYDGPPYDGGSSDIIGKLEIKEDGVHRLQLTDLFGGTRNDARNVYRLVIRKPAPDFAIAAWGLHMELRNGDRNALSKPLALRAGATVALEVVAVRRDGFDGEIELIMEDLPDGVTAHGLKIAAGSTRGIMLITADQNAPPSLANVTFYGKATLDGETQTRPVQMAAVAWPIVDSWGEIPRPRLVTGMPVSVTQSEFAPLSIAAAEKKVWEVAAGEKLTIPLVQTRRSEFSGSTLQLKTFGAGFEGVPRFDVSLDADQSEAVLDLAALKTPPGDYLIAFYGSAVVKYRYNPDAVRTAEKAHKSAEEFVTLAAAELQQRTTEAAAATSENKAAADAAVAEAATKKQAAETSLAAAAAKLKTVSDQAAPRDTV